MLTFEETAYEDFWHGIIPTNNTSSTGTITTNTCRSKTSDSLQNHHLRLSLTIRCVKKVLDDDKIIITGEQEEESKRKFEFFMKSVNDTGK